MLGGGIKVNCWLAFRYVCFKPSFIYLRPYDKTFVLAGVSHWGVLENVTRRQDQVKQGDQGCQSGIWSASPSTGNER